MPLTRSRKPMKRSRLNPQGKKASLWRKVKAKGEKKLLLENRIYCLACGSSDPTPAHAFRRWHTKSEEILGLFAPLCADCHRRIDLLGERFAYPLITHLIECAEAEREPDICFATATDNDLRELAERLMPEETFFALRQKVARV